MEFKELHYPNTSRAERVQANLNCCMQSIKNYKTQATETSLGIIAQCQIDISYTLALILDEMLERKDKAIPLDKVKQAKDEIERNAYPIVHGVNNHDIGMTLGGIFQVLDKLIESEEK